MTANDNHVALLVRTHIRKMALVAAITNSTGKCTTCGTKHPPSELKLRSPSVPRLAPLARWTRINRLLKAFSLGDLVEAVCTCCEGRRSAARTRAAS